MSRAAFYVWTQTQLANAVLIRRSTYSEYDADLYYLEIGRISEKSLTFLRNTGFFSNVVALTLPQFDEFASPWARFWGIKQIERGRFFQKQFHSMVSKAGTTAEYDVFLTAGFWAETLYLLRAVAEKKMPDIYFIEEGLSSYAKSCFRCRIDSDWKEAVEKWLCFGRWARDASRRVRGLYLMAPQYYYCDDRLALFPITQDESDDVWRAFLEVLREGAPLEEYRLRTVLFIASGLRDGYEPDHRGSDAVLQAAVQRYGAEHLVYKAHPTEWGDTERLARLRGLGIFVDDANYWFEAIFPLIDWEEKIVITRNSGSLFTLVCVEQARPRLILTHRLYKSFQNNGDPVREYLCRVFQQCYGATGGITVPDGDESKTGKQSKE